MESKIVRKPIWLELFIPGNTWVTVYPKIYCPFYPNEYLLAVHRAIVEHEKVHIRQQYEYGKWKWLFKYLTNKEFRKNQEIEAFVVQLKYEPKERHKDLKYMFASDLSGSYYHHACKSFEEALNLIEYHLTNS